MSGDELSSTTVWMNHVACTLSAATTSHVASRIATVAINKYRRRRLTAMVTGPTAAVAAAPVPAALGTDDVLLERPTKQRRHRS